jgi:hypothetical protein
MKNITYLIGAGASFRALPLVSNLRDELLDFADSIPKMSETGPPNKSKKNSRKTFTGWATKQKSRPASTR